MESYAELRASHVSSRRDGDQSQAQARHAQLLLRALETLLLTRHADDPFPIVFKSLQHVFAFERAMVLAETHKDVIHCIAAVPDDMVGVGWTAAERELRIRCLPPAPSMNWMDGGICRAI